MRLRLLLQVHLYGAPYNLGQWCASFLGQLHQSRLLVFAKADVDSGGSTQDGLHLSVLQRASILHHVMYVKCIDHAARISVSRVIRASRMLLHASLTIRWKFGNAAPFVSRSQIEDN